MPSLLVTLLGGGFALAVVFFVLYRFTSLRGKLCALLAGALALGLYLPYAIARWPGADVFAIHVAVFVICAYALGIIAAQRDRRTSAAADTGRWFHWGPALLVGFFLTVVAVNAVFITVAQRGLAPRLAAVLLPEPPAGREVHSVFPGTVEHDYQENQAAYNRYLAQVESQRERGWRLHKGWIGTPVAGQPAIFQLSVSDRHGSPLTGATVSGRFLRPADSRQDQAFEMVERGIGVYQVEIVLPAPGEWKLLLHVRRGEELHELRASTTVAPAEHG